MIEIGTKRQVRRTVTEERTAAHIGSGDLPVFGTPYMAAMMEEAAVACLRDALEEGQSSVGTRLDIAHDAPTPVGMEVWAEAEVVSVEGRRIGFAVRAWDRTGPIGSGSHDRVLIDRARFLDRCRKRAES